MSVQLLCPKEVMRRGVDVVEDESLWNRDRSRYAGRPPLPDYQGNSDEGKVDLMEHMKRVDEWSEKCFNMTEDEKKQEKRAVDAFLKTLEPLDYDLIDEINF